MTATETTREVDLSALSDDGDTLDIGDGQTLRLKIEPDDRSLLDESGPDTWCGELAWSRRSAYDTRQHRPDGYNGRARIIYRDNHDAIWWQPPTDVPDDRLDSFAATLCEILEYGYVGIILELLEGTDAYGRPIVTRSEALWGIEPFPSAGYVAEVVSSLWDELTDHTGSI